MWAIDVVREGDRIAAEMRARRRDNVKGLNLNEEAFCKERVWKSWFEAGRWTLSDQTQPWTAKVNIWDLPNSREIFDALKSQSPIPDGTISRGQFTIMLDYKFKENTARGIWIECGDYDAYVAKRGWFQLFIWDNSKRKRYVHRVQDPSKYSVETLNGKRYYNITADCFEVPLPDVPIEDKLPNDMLAEFQLNAKYSCGTDERSKVVVRGKTHIAKRMKRQEYERLDNTAYDTVMRPKRAHVRTSNVNILGFDTEFNTETGELLSVQMALIDDNDKLCSTCRIEGLEGYDAKSLLVDAESFMRMCHVNLGDKIVMIAHFATADIGHLANHFNQFKFRPIHSALHADMWDEGELPDGEGVRARRVGKLKIIDLFAYYSTNLARIGDMIGLPKLEIEVDKITDVKRHDIAKFKEYACRDAEITVKAFCTLRDMLWEKFGVELLKCASISAVADNIFRTRYLRKPSSPIETSIHAESYKIKSGYSRRKVKGLHYAGSLDQRHLAIQAYWGGRAENYVHGLIEGDFTLYDVASLYPACAILQPLPYCDTKWVKLHRKDINAHEGFAEVTFSFPSETLYPCLPVHGSYYDRLYFPLEGLSYCTLSEVREALRLGCKIEKFKGYGFNPTSNEVQHDLKRYVTDFMRGKAESEGLTRETFKMLLNALIGKFAQRHTDDDVIRGWKRTMKVGSSWSPEWACLITGKARAIMSQFINRGALMTVTDSVLLPSNASIECDGLRELKDVGSNLEVVLPDVRYALLVRSRLYALLNGERQIVKEAHHAVHLTSEQCKLMFKKSIEDGVGVESYGERLHLVGYHEASTKGLKLGSGVMKPSRIHWRWDYKRVLRHPVANMFRDYAWSTPIVNVETFETATFNATRKRKPKLARGRPRTLDDDMRALMLKLRAQGCSIRAIASSLNVSASMVQRALK